MEVNQEKLSEILNDFLKGFEEAQKQNPNIDVDQYLAEKVAQYGIDGLQEEVKTSSEFIDELDRNTAKVLEDTKKMRLDSWVEKNIYENIPEKDREEVANGLKAAAEVILEESTKEIEEEM
ncbi:MAG: hypothetical protein K5757_12070 [Bacteroidaceae bacterium]|jgi:hypothetical protein|nr:hypothetical protein [Bacteroidaceae bacterium]